MSQILRKVFFTFKCQDIVRNKYTLDPNLGAVAFFYGAYVSSAVGFIIYFIYTTEYLITLWLSLFIFVFMAWIAVFSSIEVSRVDLAVFSPAILTVV